MGMDHLEYDRCNFEQGDIPAWLVAYQEMRDLLEKGVRSLPVTAYFREIGVGEVNRVELFNRAGWYSLNECLYVLIIPCPHVNYGLTGIW